METDKSLAILCKYLYIIYALTMLMQMAYQTMLFGMLAMLAAVIMTYAKRSAAKGTVYETHFQWMLRTFWIGGGVYLPLVTLIGFCIIYPSIDLEKLQNAILSGEVTDTTQIADMVMQDNRALMWTAMLGTMGPFLLWWLWRCWKGYKALQAGKPIDKVMSWL